MDSLNYIIERVSLRQKELGGKFNINQMRSIIREKATPIDEFNIENIEIEPGPYTKKILFSKPKLEIAIIIWKPGAASNVRDNGGSYSIVRVLKGEMNFELFDDDFKKTGEGSVPAVDTFDIPKGMVHRMFNSCLEEEAVTLHFYCPRVRKNIIYSQDSIKL